MPIDPNVVPAYQTPDVLGNYGRLLSLKHMQANQAQQQRLDPLIYRQQQAVTSQQEIAAKQAQQAQKSAQGWVDYLKTHATESDPTTPAQPSPDAAPQPPAAPATPEAPAPNAAPVPLNAMAAQDQPDAPPQRPSPTAPPATQQTAAPDPVPLSAMAQGQPQPASTAAPATPTPTATVTPQATQQAVAEAARASKAARTLITPIDPLKVADNALRDGAIDPIYHQAITKQILDHRKEKAAVDEAELKLSNARNDRFLGTLRAFRTQSLEDQAKNWKGYLQEQFNDGNLTAPHYSMLLKAHDTVPDPATLDRYMLAMRIDSGQTKAALEAQQLATSKSAQAAHNSTIARNAELTQEKKLQDARTAVSKSYASVTNEDEHNNWMADVAQKYPDIAQDYGSLGYTRDGSTAKTIRNLALTPEQQRVGETADVSAAERHTRDIEAARHSGVMEGQGNTRIDLERQRIEQAATARAASLSPLKSKLLTDVSAMQAGKKLPTTGNDLKAAVDAGYGVGDPEIEPYRADLRDWADKIGKNEVTVQHTQAATEKLKTGGRGGFVLGYGPDGKIGGKLPASSGGQEPPAQPSGQTNRPAQAPPATVKMKSPDGKIKPIPAELVDHYKKLGGIVVN